METKGLVIVHTGDGKGKTTSAMGMALRGAGHGLRTLMIQFIKGSWHYGELEAARRLEPYFTIKPMGRGFIRFDKNGPDPEDLQAVREAWEYFKEQMLSGGYDMIILDEINYVIEYNLLSLEEVLETIESRPQGLHLVLTGRNARDALIEVADLVTEMREIKHPYNQGIKAQKGIEF
ncbi:MAG: cob(I)yrinic acid a,c-diamide adenosyltransferase [Deltaproteobacteria bacterium]|nr:cob(I)yrinic acid a,c-diamide adenosyltransferase [Deltaproteobacteria bacterium]